MAAIQVLLLVGDSRTRDIIRSGLSHFQQFAVDHAPDAAGVERVKHKAYDLVILDTSLSAADGGLGVARTVLGENERTEVILLAPEHAAKQLSKEKGCANIFAVVPLPIQTQQFFKTLARAKDRILLKQA
jgi:CheY-like chemotaxis protein